MVELTLGHLLSSVRHLPKADEHLRGGLWSKKKLKGTELSGKKLGLVGFGRISKGVADISHNLGMEVHYYDPFVRKIINLQVIIVLKNYLMNVLTYLYIATTSETKD